LDAIVREVIHTKPTPYTTQHPTLDECLQILLDNNLAMTDLKPDNTIFDTDRRLVSIIDIGGIITLKVKKIYITLIPIPIRFKSPKALPRTK
jgi:hypothetical protein